MNGMNKRRDCRMTADRKLCRLNYMEVTELWQTDASTPYRKSIWTSWSKINNRALRRWPVLVHE